MNKRLFALRAQRLTLLFFLPPTLSVTLTTNSFASTINSPGGNSNSQASLFIQANSVSSMHGVEKVGESCRRLASTDGGSDRWLAQSEKISGESERPSSSTGISCSNPDPVQGEPVKITIADDASSADSVTFNGESVKLFTEEVDGKSVKTALIAISPLLKPGKYEVVSGEAKAAITVHAAGFGIQRLRLPKDKDNFNASPGEKEAMNKAKSTVSDEKRWQGTFQKPVRTGRLSTRFGVKRVVNGKPLKDYFHSGLDFAAPIGTPIHAAAPGRVVVAHTGWKLHGNVVCIDHGRGVVSIGIHMTKVNVKVGDQVETGQVVGTVGRTGRASGPHLHYGIYVNNVASNPEFWFRNQY